MRNVFRTPVQVQCASCVATTQVLSEPIQHAHTTRDVVMLPLPGVVLSLPANWRCVRVPPRGYTVWICEKCPDPERE